MRLRKIGLVGLVFLSISCSLQQRHQAVVVDTAVYSALAAIDDTEMTLFEAGQITPEKHKAVSAELVKLLKAGRDFNSVVKNWKAGALPPYELKVVISELRSLTQSLENLFQDGTTKSTIMSKVLAAENLIISLLVGG